MNEKKRLLAAALAEAEAAQREVLKADTTLANFNAEAFLLEEEAQQTAQKKKGQAQEALSRVGSTGVRTGGMRECRSQPGRAGRKPPCVAHPNAPRSEAHASQPLPTDTVVRLKKITNTINIINSNISIVSIINNKASLRKLQGGLRP